MQSYTLELCPRLLRSHSLVIPCPCVWSLLCFPCVWDHVCVCSRSFFQLWSLALILRPGNKHGVPSMDSSCIHLFSPLYCTHKSFTPLRTHSSSHVEIWPRITQPCVAIWSLHLPPAKKMSTSGRELSTSWIPTSSSLLKLVSDIEYITCSTATVTHSWGKRRWNIHFWSKKRDVWMMLRGLLHVCQITGTVRPCSQTHPFISALFLFLCPPARAWLLSSSFQGFLITAWSGQRPQALWYGFH